MNEAQNKMCSTFCLAAATLSIAIETMHESDEIIRDLQPTLNPIIEKWLKENNYHHHWFDFSIPRYDEIQVNLYYTSDYDVRVVFIPRSYILENLEN